MRASARGLTPWGKATVGGVLAVVVLVLWFVPLPGEGYTWSVAEIARYRLGDLITRVTGALGTSGGAGRRLAEQLPLAIVAITLLMLVVLPAWRGRVARRARDAAISARRAAADEADEVRHLDDGRIIGDDMTLTGHIERTPLQLARLAEKRRMRWHSDYDRPGGARVLLDLMEALDTGRFSGESGTRPVDLVSPPEPDSLPEPSSTAEPPLDPSLLPEPGRIPDLSPLSKPDPEQGSSEEPAPRKDAAAATSDSAEAVDAIGSVYTPTVLYSSSAPDTSSAPSSVPGAGSADVGGTEAGDDDPEQREGSR